MCCLACVTCLASRENMLFFLLNSNRDIPGGPMVKDPPCRSGNSGSVPGRELRSRMPRSRQATAAAGESAPPDQEPGATPRPSAAKQINISKDR